TQKSDDEVKLWRETLDGASYISALCRPVGNQFGVVGIQIADHAEIPLSPHQLRLKSLIHLLLILRNVIIVNRSLIMQALEQATSHPP
ncbi:306_t:CDS:2, partial [Funneliformis geosporum]